MNKDSSNSCKLACSRRNPASPHKAVSLLSEEKLQGLQGCCACNDTGEQQGEGRMTCCASWCAQKTARVAAPPGEREA